MKAIERFDLQEGHIYYDGPYEHSIPLKLVKKEKSQLFFEDQSGFYSRDESGRCPFNITGLKLYERGEEE
jgi:hypothetical protein